MDLIPKQHKQNNYLSKNFGLKSRGISIEKEEKSRWSFLLNKWVILSFCALALGLAVFGGLKIYDYYLKKNIAGLEEQILRVYSQHSEETVNKVAETEKAIEIVKNLSKNQVFSSLFFEKIEALTLPEIQWKGFSIDTRLGKAELSGQAASYSFLAKQMEKFKEANFEIDISGISLKGSGVSFSAAIKFDPAILQNK